MGIGVDAGVAVGSGVGVSVDGWIDVRWFCYYSNCC